MLLRNADAVATLAVKNLSTARDFYENKLGLEKAPSEETMVAVYKSGNSTILVYESQFAGTNQATAATWPVDDVDGTVRELKAKGVKFERYDMPNVTREGDVHVFGKRRNAWMKDPDGNVLSIVNT